MAITKYTMRRPTHSNWSDFEDVSNRLARFFDDSMHTPMRAGAWLPAVSVAESTEELVLTAELPGMTDEDVSLELENDVLTISGEKTETVSEGDDERRYHVCERRFGAFSRSFTLPRSVDGANIVATFDNGVLSVRLPKAAEAKGRKIEISR